MYIPAVLFPIAAMASFWALVFLDGTAPPEPGSIRLGRVIAWSIVVGGGVITGGVFATDPTLARAHRMVGAVVGLLGLIWLLRLRGRRSETLLDLALAWWLFAGGSLAALPLLVER